MTKKQNGIIITNLVVYLLMLVWVVLFHATLESLNIAFDPDFRSISLYFYFNGRESILNVLIFVPLGLHFGVLFDKNSMVQKVGMVVATSLLLEIMQYILAMGATDIMDLINNTIGGALGLSICSVARKVLKERFNKVAVVASVLCTLATVGIVLFVSLR
ncbi:MAG: VanZ family protein [Clostridia bacterium]|nr:VanZ family protein [Clostridia bacterium]